MARLHETTPLPLDVADLTLSQQSLLIQLVHFGLQRKIGPVLVPIPAGPMAYVLYVYGESSLRIDRLSDLDALCGSGCLDYRLNRMGNAKVYLMTDRSYRQVEQWRQERGLRARLFELTDLEGEARTAVFSESKEYLYNRWGELQQLLPARLTGEMRELLYWVMDELSAPQPQRRRISFQLRRIGRTFSERLHDRESAHLLEAYARWVSAIYERLAILEVEDQQRS